MWKTVLLSTLAILVVGLLVAGCFTSRAGYASAPYTVRSTDGAFEIRDYPSLQVAVTSTTADGADNGFGRLFGYITGNNADSGKISMTTPVFMMQEPTRAMAFVLPESYRTNSPPVPKDASVTIRELPPARFAVYRFSGGRKLEKEQQSRKELEDWLKKTKLEYEGEPMFGYFDPPWTPPFLRRNEVMLRLKPNLP
jgi:SOUL heme-binding protein